MNTLASNPVPGLAPVSPVKPAVAAGPAVAEPVGFRWTWRRIREILVMVYAYGLLGFGLFFPFLLAAWSLFVKPASP